MQGAFEQLSLHIERSCIAPHGLADFHSGLSQAHGLSSQACCPQQGTEEAAMHPSTNRSILTSSSSPATVRKKCLRLRVIQSELGAGATHYESTT